MSPTSTSPSDSAANPVIARAILGRVVRELRETAGIDRDDASAHISASPSKISRMELGRVAVKTRDLDNLLAFYGIPAGERHPILELAGRLNDRQWWHESGGLDDWFASYLVFESIAQRIRTYEVRFIPGLLQTEAYAEALVRIRYTSETEIRRRVNIRMQRQRMLLKQRSQTLWAVVDEAALHEKIGSRQVMKDQIEFLIHATKHPNVRIQVLASGDGAQAGVGNSFSMLRLRIPSLPDVVYLEQIGSALFLSNPDESDPYDIAMNRLGVTASQPSQTENTLKQTLRRIGRPA